MKALMNCAMPVAVAALMFSAGCVPTSGYTVGGRVSGLSGELNLVLNGTESIAVAQNGRYGFSSRLAAGAAYNVVVAAQPAGQLCMVARASGAIGISSVYNINAVCQNLPYQVGGEVTGLLGDLTIQLNNNEVLTLSGEGEYLFSTTLYHGDSYGVVIVQQPTGQECTVENGGGTIAAADADVVIDCVTTLDAPVITHVSPETILGGYEVKVSGSNLDLASISFNGAAIEPMLRSSHELRFIAPENPLGTYALELENIAGHVSQNVVQGEVMADVVSIDSGDNHGCAVLGSGEVKCWGANHVGQLGNGTTTNSNVPVVVLGIGDAVAVSTASGRSCAALSSGGVQCWGGGSTTPLMINGLENVVALSSQSSCAVLGSGEVQCWGVNGLTSVAGIGNAVAISANCVLLSDGAVQCWSTSDMTPVMVTGISDAVAISSNCAVLGSGMVQCWGAGYNSLPSQQVLGIDNAVSIDSFGNYFCALLGTGSVKCWGRYGNLGPDNDSTWFSSTPVLVTGVADALAVSVGSQHGCFVSVAGNVKCWGENNFGQLGIRTADLSTTPVTIADLTNAESASAGGYVRAGYTFNSAHNCAVLDGGIVQCWGSNWTGQLGNGTRVSSVAPVVVTGLVNAIAVSAGGTGDSAHSCAVLSGGQVACWGSNFYGKLGTDAVLENAPGVGGHSTVAVMVSGISSAVSVSAGGSHSCAVLADGSIKCWGSNVYGQLGNGTTSSGFTPVTVDGISNAISVSAGIYHSCAVLSNGSVKCWGGNAYGQLGDGSMLDSSIPVTVSGIADAVAVSIAGIYIFPFSENGAHSCALLSTGSVQCWGSNSHGQLGNDSTIPSAIPVSVFGLGDVVSISAGTKHGCAALADGSVKCWGKNNFGQLGNATTDQSAIPVSVFGISDAISVEVGSDHSCANLLGGQLQCWGSNSFGLLTLYSSRILHTVYLPVYSQ